MTTNQHDRRRPMGRKRLQVLTLLEDAGTPLTAPEVAERLGIHGNTARFHLDGLVADGLAARSVEERTGPGRPKVLFAATSDGPAEDQRSYPLLAEMLAGFLADQLADAPAASVEAGMVWGRYLSEPPPPFQKVGETEAVDAVVEQLGRVGFESHVEDDGEDLRLEINHCPFLEVASRHQNVVCAMHLGLLRGVLEQIRAPLTATTLDPLVEPSRCTAHLQRVPAAS